MLSVQRVLGTLYVASHKTLHPLSNEHSRRLGALIAAIIFTIFPENAPILAILGFLVSLPCFYIAVAKPKHLSASRFVLLTYNLTCLYRYVSHVWSSALRGSVRKADSCSPGTISALKTTSVYGKSQWIVLLLLLLVFFGH
jgi:hypothetical protein